MKIVNKRKSIYMQKLKNENKQKYESKEGIIQIGKQNKKIKTTKKPKIQGHKIPE